MNESKIKKYKMTVWLPALVLLIGIGFLSPIVHISHFEHRNYVETTAKLNAETYSERMLGELNKGIAVTTALEQILISEKGEVNDFDIIAKNLMTEYIQSIQLAPAGIVTKVYPASEGDAEGHNIFEYAESAKLAAYSRDHDEVTAQGPFLLAQGGEGLVIRNPVTFRRRTILPNHRNSGASPSLSSRYRRFLKIPSRHFPASAMNTASRSSAPSTRATARSSSPRRRILSLPPRTTSPSAVRHGRLRSCRRAARAQETRRSGSSLRVCSSFFFSPRSPCLP